MKRRLIWIIVAVAVLGAAGFLTYDRYFGGELRRGQELREALATELASAGVAFTSMKYDWRSRRIVAEGLVATKLPQGIKVFSIGHATYRGADPATWRTAMARTDEKSGELIGDLTLSDIVIGFDEDAEFRQASLLLKNVSLGQAVARGSLPGKVQENPLVLAADLARRLRFGLLEAENARFWHPKAQATFEQRLVRLEDWRGGNFSEFRLEGLTLSVAVVVRAKLDEYFVESVKARRFLENIHRTPLVTFSEQIAAALAGLGAPAASGDQKSELTFPPLSESGVVAGDTATIGFELLIPAVGRIAFEEISTKDRQFINGLEVGGKSKITGLELQFNMLTQVLMAAMDSLGVDAAATLAETGTQASAWLASRNGVGGPAPALATDSMPTERTAAAPLQRAGRALASLGARPEESGSGKVPEAKPQDDDKDPPANTGDGKKVEQGPAAPVPQVWSNEIKPPQNRKIPEPNNREIAEIIRKLGFDNMRIDSESEAAFDEQTKEWTLAKFTFDIQRFWNLGMNVNLSGMAAIEELGHVPMGADGWWTGPKADAVGDRLLKEGRFEGLTFTYQDQGFVPRLLSLVAEEQGVTVEAMVSKALAEMFSEKDGAPALQAEGLREAIEAFLLTPQTITLRFGPADPVPLSAFPEMNRQKTPLPEIASRLGFELTLNGRTFTEFKKSAAIGSDIEGEQD